MEADFRYSLVRVRENIEGMALYGGEAEEKRGLRPPLRRVIGNWWAIMPRTKMLTFLTAGYEPGGGDLPVHRRRAALFRRRGSRWAG